MSCWICGNKTLSIVTDVVKEISDKDYDTNELMTELSRLNIKNVEQYYGHNDCGHTDVITGTEYEHLDVKDAQKHKSVCCYLYQTTNYVEDPLLKLLEKWADDNRHIYEPYWDLHKWDIDSHL